MGHCKITIAFYLTLLYGVYVSNWQFSVQELKLGSIAIQQSMNKNNCIVMNLHFVHLTQVTSTINVSQP